MGKTPIPFFVCALAGMALSLVSVPVVPAMDERPESPQPAWVETDVDRPGSDFRILWLRGGSEACQEACAQNPQCKSYTYVRPGIEGRLEGCWLKNGVPPPVPDGCCISGVKTEETVSRYVREPVLPPLAAVTPPDAGKREAPVRRSAPAESEVPVKKVPPTGSGKRGVEGMNYAAVLPERGSAEGTTVPGAVSPAPPAVGAGRRDVRGMDFAAADPSAGGRRERAGTDASAPTSRTGRREIRGVSYAASPLSGRVASEERRRKGAALRNVSGADFRAIPP